LEFFYVCLALGFEGRYRDAANGRQALGEIKDKLYGLITRRRPRPEGLSERWRTPAAQAAADAALATVARANAARVGAERVRAFPPAAARDLERGCGRGRRVHRPLPARAAPARRPDSARD